MSRMEELVKTVNQWYGKMDKDEFMSYIDTIEQNIKDELVSQTGDDPGRNPYFDGINTANTPPVVRVAYMRAYLNRGESEEFPSAESVWEEYQHYYASRIAAE